MPQYSSFQNVPRPLLEVFAFCSQPANHLALVPIDLHGVLLAGPEVLYLGARLTWKLRRWGVTQTIVYEVTALVENALIVQEQHQGPFPRWTHRQIFETIPDGTRLRDEIDFEPPRGMLGLLVTETVIRHELDALFAYRAQKLRELLVAP
jgi:ligand-binding SRPBCC domain-containing protein